jgi:hypothetical protein
MAEYELYCFAQSGNAYRAALMLNLIGPLRRQAFFRPPPSQKPALSLALLCFAKEC